MDYYLGIDIGTTSSKAIAFSPDGKMIGNFSFAYEMQHPQSHYSEQDPEEIWQAVISGINSIVKAFSPSLPLFISFSAAMHSLLAVDEKGKILLPCIIWADNRAAAIADHLRSTAEAQWIYNATGVPVHAMSPLCKLLWLKENEPRIFNSAHKFIGIKEYIFLQLFNEYVVDTSVASATGLLNINSLLWDEKVLQFIGLSSDCLSAVVSVKQVYHYKDYHPQLTFSAPVAVVIGASDGALSNLGTGATQPGAMAVTIGTSGAVRLVFPHPVIDEQMRTFCYHLQDNYYIAGGANNNGAVVLQWLKETVLETNDTFEQLFAQANTIEAGSENLLLLPYLLGERAPLWNSNAKGVFFGLTIQHTKAHLVRAAMEGVVYCLYSIGKILAEKSNIAELHASGGFAKSSLWLQILADVFNTNVIVSDTVESSSLGAVIIGAQAMGLTADFENNILSTFEPGKANHEAYTKSFQKFEKIYDLLKQEMNAEG